MSDRQEIRYYQPARTSGYAICSFIFSFAGYCSILFGIIAVIFGHIAIGKIRCSDGTLRGEVLALFGLVIGYIGLAFQAVITGFFVYAMIQADGESGMDIFGRSQFSGNTVVTDGGARTQIGWKLGVCSGG